MSTADGSVAASGVPDAEVRHAIAAPADVVYALVSDITRIGEWSPEATGGRWVGGATGAAVGARFRGNNRRGLMRWTTTCTVTAAEPGRSFAFDVDLAGAAISHWAYDIRPEGQGCVVTESWRDLRPQVLRLLSMPLMAVKNRPAHNRRGMVDTLNALGTEAESRQG